MQIIEFKNRHDSRGMFKYGDTMWIKVHQNIHNTVITFCFQVISFVDLSGRNSKFLTSLLCVMYDGGSTWHLYSQLMCCDQC